MNVEGILKKYWGFDEFRPLQKEIIQSVLSKKDTLALLPTGGGKSVCFHVPGLMLDGVCLVVSPLIALMKDQVSGLKKRKIKAAAVVSGMRNDEIDVVLENAVNGAYKFLYVSPERLKTDIFQKRLERMQVSLIAVDEAHCISQWGYDFRPSYLEISKIRELKNDIPILALTATATPKVVNDIQEKLGFKSKNIFQKSFVRSNLGYVSLEADDKTSRMVDLLRRNPGSSVIYAGTRNKCQKVSAHLSKLGVTSDFYHAGCSMQEREQKMTDWMRNKCRVMVCTNAFGMGIDKPDVRTVIHLEIPTSLEAYFQEAGRAGRDGNRAYSFLLFHKKDLDNMDKYVDSSFPEIETVRSIYTALGNHFQLAIGSGINHYLPFNIIEFCIKYKFSATIVHSALKLLERNEYLTLTENAGLHSRVKMISDHRKVYEFQTKHTQHQPLIEHLLRGYSGIYDHYVKVSEYRISKLLNKSEALIIKSLKLLDKAKLIRFIPKSDQPFIFMDQARVASERILLSPETYRERKEELTAKITAVKGYIASNGKCRSKLLVGYFGEIHNVENCGICDQCLMGKTTHEIGDKKERASILSIILKVETIEMEKLVEKINPTQKDKYISSIRKMIDEGVLELSNNQLSLKKS